MRRRAFDVVTSALGLVLVVVLLVAGGLLLEAYGFSKIGTIMLYGSIASCVLAAVMLMLVGLGFCHAQKTPPEHELLAPRGNGKPTGVVQNGHAQPAPELAASGARITSPSG